MKRRSLLSLVVLVTLACFGPAVPAAAGTDLVSLLRSGVYCEVTPRVDGFEIRWNAAEASEADRVVVERRMADTWWWRGRMDPSTGVFEDGVAPRNAARAEFRVVLKDASGSVLNSQDCDLVPTQGFRCVVTATTNGFHVEVEDTSAAGLDGDALDFVVRRSVRPGSWFWRGRTDAVSFDDVSSPTVPVLYEVLARNDRVIVAGARCRNDLADPQCVTAVTAEEAWSLGVSRAYEIDDADIEAADPSGTLSWVLPAPDGSLYFVMPAGDRSSLHRYDPADGSNVMLGADIGPAGEAWVFWVDRAGVAFVLADEGAGDTARFYGPDGTVEDLVVVDTAQGFMELIGETADGRVVLTRYSSQLAGEDPAFVRTLVRTPETGEFDIVHELEGSQVIGVTGEGDLIVVDPFGGDRMYFLYDDACV